MNYLLILPALLILILGYMTGFLTFALDMVLILFVISLGIMLCLYFLASSLMEKVKGWFKNV